MKRSKAVLSLMLIVLLGSQWLVPSHLLWAAGMERPVPYHMGHSAHSNSLSRIASLQHSCCEDSTSSLHGHLCCEACPAVQGAIADLNSYMPYLSLTVVEPHDKSSAFLAPPLHPPTL